MDAAAKKDASARGVEGNSAGPGQKRCILVIDDYFIIRCNHKVFLERAGFEVVEASNGEEALSKLKKRGPEAFSLIMVDLVMPVMNGADFMSACKREFGERLPPMLVCSSVSELPVIKKVAEIGIDGYIIKPVDYKALAKKLSGIFPSGAG